MRTITIVFSRPKKWMPFAAAIMWMDKSDADHACIKFHSESWNEDFIYQASHHQTNFMGGDYFDSININVEEFKLTVSNELEAKIGSICVKREGKLYAILQCVGIGLVYLTFLGSFGKIKIKKNPFADGDNKTNCIEEVAEVLKEGLGIESGLDMDLVSVKPFREWIRTIADK